MRKFTVLMSALLLTLTLAGAASAQMDSLGFVDTLKAEVTQLDDYNWSVRFAYVNDYYIAGLSIPFKMNAGLTRIVADSVHWGERVADFGFKAFRPDTAIQTVTLGLIGSLTGAKVRLDPGNGDIATVFISAIDDDEPLTKLHVDTTTTHPNNSLMTVADPLQGEPPDTVRMANPAMKIFPEFVMAGQEMQKKAEGTK